VKILDIPELHSFEEENAIEFFNVLSKVDLDIFSNDVIRCLIDFKWPLVKEFTVKILFIPFIFYISLFIAFSNAFNGQVAFDDDEAAEKKFKLAKLIIIILLYVLSVFFLSNEIVQLFKQKLHEYFSSIWNFFDVLLPVLVLTVISYHLAEM
jgi:hypothetical protein